jgi:membrane-anchored glycerophosphoryl diester phosphodiesterase (GDPDase)
VVADALTHEIVDVFALLGVLLVFLVAYVTYLQTRVAADVRAGIPDFEASRKAVRARLRATRRLVLASAVSIVCVLLLLLPLSIRVIAGLSHRADFPTAQVGLLVTDVFLIGLLIAAGALALGISKRIQEADAPGNT